MRAYLVVAALLLLIFGGITAYLYQQYSVAMRTDWAPPPVTVAAATARREIWPSMLEAVGTINAARGVNLAAETSGEIIDISVQSGDQVSEGQLLLTLNDRVERARRKRQEANLVLARQLYERDARLVEQKSIPQSQYDRSRADLDAAIASLAETDALLDNKRIVAPFAGTLGIIKVKTGDYIEPDTAITTLQDLTELEVDFSVPARYFGSLRKGLVITLRSAASTRSFPARLQAIDASVDRGTRNLALRAALLESDGLLPGMFAHLSIDLGQSTEVVTLPETAVTYSLQGNTVYIVSEDDNGLLVTPRVVQTGAVKEGRITITGGLDAGVRVVSVGQNKLYRGARIQLEENPPAFAQ